MLINGSIHCRAAVKCCASDCKCLFFSILLSTFVWAAGKVAMCINTAADMLPGGGLSVEDWVNRHRMAGQH